MVKNNLPSRWRVTEVTSDSTWSISSLSAGAEQFDRGKLESEDVRFASVTCSLSTTTTRLSRSALSSAATAASKQASRSVESAILLHASTFSRWRERSCARAERRQEAAEGQLGSSAWQPLSAPN
ncbi:MAG: hypothetical protein WDN24_05735 [Sphingomonas sp.]